VFLIRRAKVEDVGTLLKLAKMVHFINLPADKDIITAKAIHSRNCFIKAAGGTLADGNDPGKRKSAGYGGFGAEMAQSELFMFSLEDTESGAVLGTSQLVASMGGPGRPTVSFKLSRKQFFSESLQSGTSHIVAKLYLDESGPTEIGGLILQPSYRRHKMKLGRALSLVRFHFIGLHRKRFSDRILAEMMAPITPDGHNLLWEYFGRRFINLTYTEADRFCQYSREFMTSLLPREEVYLSLLPPEARALVGQVGPETIPARKMLEKLGFEYHDFIDPFDGGPYLHADTDSIPVVNLTRTARLGEAAAVTACKHRGLVSVLDTDGDFRALDTRYCDAGGGMIQLPRKSMQDLQVEPGATVGVTEFDGPSHESQAAGNGKAKRSAGRTKKKTTR
jgi:arginine N-succinyltransferase